MGPALCLYTHKRNIVYLYLMNVLQRCFGSGPSFPSPVHSRGCCAFRKGVMMLVRLVDVGCQLIQCALCFFVLYSSFLPSAVYARFPHDRPKIQILFIYPSVVNGHVGRRGDQVGRERKSRWPPNFKLGKKKKKKERNNLTHRKGAPVNERK